MFTELFGLLRNKDTLRKPLNKDEYQMLWLACVALVAVSPLLAQEPRRYV
jgi:hypothetical protein